MTITQSIPGFPGPTRGCNMLIRTMIKTAALAAMFLAGSAQALPLLTNGSFEANVRPNGTWALYTGLTGWAASNRVELRNNVAGTAQHGVNFVELDAASNSSIFQSVNTVAGQNYLLSFWYSPRSGVSASSNPIGFAWGGTPVASVTGNGSGSGNVWRQYSYNVVGTGALTELRFSAGGTSDSLGGSLDNVALTAVPEPGSMALFALGLGLLGYAARRKQA